MNFLDYHPSIFHDYHCPILRNSFPPVRYAPVPVMTGGLGTSHDWSPSPSEVPSRTEYLRRTGYPVRLGPSRTG